MNAVASSSPVASGSDLDEGGSREDGDSSHPRHEGSSVPRIPSPVALVQAVEASPTHSSAALQHAVVEKFVRELDSEKLFLLPAGVVIKGDLNTNGNAAVIAGRVEGNITAGGMPVIIKEGGEVVGTIESDDYVLVAGKATAATPDGQAIATKGLWILAETGYVKGGVAYGRQRAYEGGTLNGRAAPYSEYKA
jgi:cytoskeletal protein CcmA (bactofilin family)